MKGGLLSIGDELLIGQVVNTNAAWLGDQLTAAGVIVERVVEVGDERSLIAREIDALAREHDLVIVSGGLGPTHDDVTREAICDLLGCGLTIDDAQLARIEQRFRERGIELNDRSRRQATIPAGVGTLPNDHGSAPALHFELHGSTVYALPGVPSELKGIMTDQILPTLQRPGIARQTFLLFGVTESALADALTATLALLSERVTLAYLPSIDGIRLRAMTTSSEAEDRAGFDELLRVIRRDAAEWIVAEGDRSLSQVVGDLLLEGGRTLATAESCTGGGIGAAITSVPGSSAWYLGGLVSYANEAKSRLLGVDPALIERHGAVSREVAEAMATGAREATGADLAVSVTGIAGPSGGTPEKPVGTVWIGIASDLGVEARRYTLGNDRQIVRARSVATALDTIRRVTRELNQQSSAGRNGPADASSNP